MRKPHPLTGFVSVRGRRAGFDFEEVVQADQAIERALGGDLQPLANRLRSAKKLLPAERALAADFLDGTREAKNPTHRPPKDETHKRTMLLALAVWQRMKLGATEKAAVEDVSEVEGKSVGTVRASIRAHPEMFAGMPQRRARPRK